jgi:hypothetical protein
MSSKLPHGWADTTPPAPRIHVTYWQQIEVLTSFIEDALDWESRRLPESLLAESFVELRQE